jgi:tetratricopeptide (TPR) repeat protein
MTNPFTARNRLVVEAFGRARESYLRNEVGPAIEELARIVDKFPEETGARLYLALYLGQEKRFDEAIDHSREAVRLRPDLEKASAILFHLLTAAGQCDKAFEEAKRYAADGDITHYLKDRLKECILDTSSIDEEAIAD